MDILGTLRNPDHTGERRCVPCTIVNVALLWLGTNALVLLGTPIVAVGVFVAGLVVIWLRGYLVPYTPEFAPRLVAATPIPDEWFHGTRGVGALSPEDVDGETLIGELARAGVVEVDGDRLLLDRAFEERWHDEMDRLATQSLSALADELRSVSALPDARPVAVDGQQWIALGGQSALVARHVAVAELGVIGALEGAVDDPKRRLAMARPLREFLTACPVCDTAFEQSTEVACCGGHTNPRETPRETLVCPTCEQEFLRFPPSPED